MLQKNDWNFIGFYSCITYVSYIYVYLYDKITGITGYILCDISAFR